MSTNNYLAPYYFTQPPPNFNPSTSWNYSWPSSQSQNVRSTQDTRAAPPPPPPPYPPPANSRGSTPVPVVSALHSEQKPQTYYNSTQPTSYRNRSRYSNSTTSQYNGTAQYSTQLGQYSSTSAQYSPTTSGQYTNSSSPGYSRSYYGKRKNDEADGMKKSGKKKKKPLSQNIPQRKDWSVEDARRALMVEKDYNKRNKSQSLIIKFPDIELNRDIVAKFNSEIESVHFQQPSTPRFCFVSLKDSADPEKVIKELNKTPFGQGFLTAEYKKDREDEINIGPEDIDPLTLYVGNLAQEVTKEDMVNTYPNQKRIDIGYAKKMKYTRYAFVSFKTVDDSIEAFRKTHATQMYSKSLIVRFRRLNGTVGMPGEPKPQMPQRNDIGEHHNGISHANEHNEVGSHNTSSDMETEASEASRLAPWEMVDVSNWERDLKVKEEPPGETEDEDEAELERKPSPTSYVSPFMPGSLDLAFSMHKPKVKVEVKEEKGEGDYSMARSRDDARSRPSKHDELELKRVKDIDSDCAIISTDKIKKENDKTDDFNTYNSLRSLNSRGRTIDFPPVKVKRETPTPTLDEISNDFEEKVSNADTEESVRVKSEPNDEDDELNYGDKDDSSDSNDFNFSSMLSNIEARKRRKLKKSIP